MLHLAAIWDVLRPAGRLVTVAADSEGRREPPIRGAFFVVRADRTQLTELAHLIDAG